MSKFRLWAELWWSEADRRQIGRMEQLVVQYPENEKCLDCAGILPEGSLDDGESECVFRIRLR